MDCSYYPIAPMVALIVRTPHDIDMENHHGCFTLACWSQQLPRHCNRIIFFYQYLLLVNLQMKSLLALMQNGKQTLFIGKEASCAPYSIQLVSCLKLHWLSSKTTDLLTLSKDLMNRSMILSISTMLPAHMLWRMHSSTICFSMWWHRNLWLHGW